MRSTKITTLFIAVSLAAAFATIAPAGLAQAAITPTLSLSSAGGSSVNVSVSADANANVMFYYNVASATGMQTMTLGTTNSSGYFSTTLNAGSYGINSGQSVYVIVDGAQSAMQSWPSPTGTPTLNVTSVTVGLGQSASVYEQGSSAPVYAASNSSPSIANVQTNGTQITVTGEQVGSTNANICYTGTASSCVNLTVIVQSGIVQSNNALSFSENNFTVAIGQGTNVTVTGGTGSYSITGNSNAGIASVSLNGNSISISPLETGSTNITACDTNNNCGTLYLTVSSSGSTGTGGTVIFGVSNPTLTVGQSLNVALSGGSTYYISSNSNTNITETSINGSTLDLYGENAGSDSLTVCANGGSCNTLYITVTGSTASTVTTSSNNSTLLSTIQSMQAQLAQIVTQIQSMATTLTQLAASAGLTTTTGTTSASTGLYDFTQFLGVGSQGSDVTALQQYLTQKGFFSGSITGYFGTETQAAVESYQSAHGISAVGYVGPSTRAALNSGE